ncbi:hypothetical protein T4C_13233 [Trichinella pseudospiralis]|uniref:Uncharacterized protein n=1 Tax=Trichinella pseudospiralis TaxID=6337 RepID=A0A0V1JTI7_TRIPS|nr:hypothetical protein T4C_13233 [Trichinella pseudospiralis]
MKAGGGIACQLIIYLPPSLVSDSLLLAVSTRQAAGDGRMRERLLGSLLHAHLCGSLLWHPNLWTVCYGSLLISKLEQKYYDDNNSVGVTPSSVH